MPVCRTPDRLAVAVDTDRPTWDIFCRVVDNYGDVGIAWRLARQLAAGGHRSLRLFVDGIDVLARLEPRIDPESARQRVAGIDVQTWSASDDGPAIEPARVVVELLGCGLPSSCLDAMEASTNAHRDPTVWIDYEHLSAEAWTEDFHALPSPHPTRTLVKHFFYPGFGPRSGGLPFEPGLEARRLAFVDDPAMVRVFRQTLGIVDARRHLSLFAYPDAPVAALFDALARDEETWSIVVPEGVLVESIGAWFEAHGVAAGRARSHESLTVTTIPFVDQEDYDRLLWSSDVNCVRGEDSFVRAQLAARPFVWAAYRQADDAHLSKLAAFDALHEADMPHDLRAVSRRWSLAWNDRGQRDIVEAARAWLARRPQLQAHAEAWSASLLTQPALVDRLVAFAADRRIRLNV